MLASTVQFSKNRQPPRTHHTQQARAAEALCDTRGPRQHPTPTTEPAHPAGKQLQSQGLVARFLRTQQRVRPSPYPNSPFPSTRDPPERKTLVTVLAESHTEVTE